MSKNKEYVKNTFILLIGKFATQFTSFLLLPLFTHYLLTDDYGWVDLLQSYIFLFVPVLTLRLDSVVFRFLIDKRKDETGKKVVISNVFAALAVTTTITILFSLLFILLFKFKYILSVIINLIVLMLSNVLLQILRGLGKNKEYSIASIITGLTSLVLNVILIIYFKLGANSILISSSVANIFVIIYVLFVSKTLTYFKYKYINKKEITKMLKYSLPMIPNSLSWWIVSVSDRTIISIFIGKAFNGIYTVSCKFSNLLNSVFSIFSMSWQESASMHINDDDRDEFFSNMINKLFIAFSCVSLLIIATLPLVYNLLIGNEYLASYNYIPILLYANSWNIMISLIGGIYIALKKTKEIASTTIVSAIINLTINLVFIKFIGLYAACISTLISYFVMSIYRHIDCKKYINLKINYFKIFIFTIVYGLSMTLYCINNFYLNILNLVFVCIYSFIINKLIVVKVLEMIKEKGCKFNMKNKIYNIIKILFMIISTLLSAYLVKVLKDLDMIPTKYFAVIIIVLLIFISLIILLLKNKKIIPNIIGIILSILIIIGSMFGIKHGNKISNIINKAFGNSGIEVTGYSVAVLKSSKYNKIEDLDGELMGYVILDDKKDEYMSLLKSKISVELKSYDDPYTLYEDLLNKKVNSIIVSEGFLQVLEEEHEDIYDRIKIIYNFEIEEKISTGKEDIKKLEPINILISGSDSRSGKIVSKTRSDVNMIMTINPKTRTILLTSIPRDYYVRLHGTTGLKDKLTHAGIYGIDMTKTTIEDLFDIKIDYTVKVGFNSVIEIVDYIGGVDIDSEYSFSQNKSDGGAKPVYIKKGINHLDGGQALTYARERHSFKNGDYQRVQNQQQVIEAIINKISKDKKLLKNYDELLEKFSELYRTDIPSKYIKLIVKQQLDDMKGWKIEKQYIKGTNAMKETYSMPGRNLFVVEEDKDSINEAREKINQIKDGK